MDSRRPPTADGQPAAKAGGGAGGGRRNQQQSISQQRQPQHSIVQQRQQQASLNNNTGVAHNMTRAEQTALNARTPANRVLQGQAQIDDIDMAYALDEKEMELVSSEFVNVMNELVEDENLVTFREEYEKLHDALRKCHSNEQKLIGKCKEMHTEISNNALRISEATRLAQEDQSTIQSLKKEIERAWKMVDEAHEREDRACETIATLRTEVGNMSGIIEKHAAFATNHETTLNEMLQTRDRLVSERTDLLAQIAKLQQQQTQQDEKLASLVFDYNRVKDSRDKLQHELTVKHAEIAREEQFMDHLKTKNDELRAEEIRKEAEIGKMKAHIEFQTSEKKLLHKQIDDKQTEIDEANHKVRQTEHEMDAVRAECDTQKIQLAAIQKEIQTLRQDLKSKKTLLATARADLGKQTRAHENNQRRIRALEDEKEKLSGRREALRTEVTKMEREIDHYKHNHEVLTKEVERMRRERDRINREMARTRLQTEHVDDQIKLGNVEKHNMEIDIQVFEKEIGKARKVIHALELERNKSIEQLNNVQNRTMKLVEECHERELEVFDLKRRISDFESKIVEQKTAFEIMRGEKNTIAKVLLEAQETLDRENKKSMLMSQDIAILKDEIRDKDKTLSIEQIEKQRLQKEKEATSLELSVIKGEIDELRRTVEMRREEEKRLMKLIQKADTEQLQQRKELERIMGERDILGAQLIRRNDELTLLYEKFRVLKAISERGEFQYRERLNDIRVLKLEVRRLRRQRDVLARGTTNLSNLKHELVQLNKELLNERIRARTLEDELKNPTNGHRWRSLKGSDPSKFEMIKKVQIYQKKLIRKTEESTRLQILLGEKEKLYLQLRSLTAKLPGSEVLQTLADLKRNISEKYKQIKLLTSDLNMYHCMFDEEKITNSRLIRELNETKQLYYATKRREEKAKQHLRQNERVSSAGSGGGASSSGGERSDGKAFEGTLLRIDSPKMMGGGFRVRSANASTRTSSAR